MARYSFGKETAMMKNNRKAAVLAFLLYCGFMLWLLFARQSNPAEVPFPVYLRAHMNLRPLRTIHLFSRLLVPPVREYLVRIAIRNLLGNILLFTPLGIFLPVLFPPLRKFFRTVLSVTFIIAVIELCQLALMVGSCDIDDLILNVSGAVLGYGLYRLFALLRRKLD